MIKRRLIIGDYDTAVNGLWTLREWELTPAEQITTFLEIPGRIDGPLDASTALTDGDPRYGSRTLTAVLESSEGSRIERESRISIMTNWLDGWRLNIVLPDDPQHYITGRVHVARLYNDPAHASVQVTAICDPWKYSINETVHVLTLSTEAQTATFVNNSRRTVVPTITVSGGPAHLVFGNASWALSDGVYALPDFFLRQGESTLTYSQSGLVKETGTVTVTYREAVL